VYQVYQDYIWKGEQEELAKKLYNEPIPTLDALCERAPAVMERYRETLWHTPEKMQLVKEEITKANASIGSLTPAVEDTIATLEFGAVESAHQSVVLGGPGYILNKAATAKKVASLSREKGLNLAPFFFVADYDEVQSELTHVRTPLVGSDGNLVSIPVPERHEHSPVYVLPLPEVDWYREVEESIRENYTAMMKAIEGSARLVYEERLEQALSVSRWAFVNSKTMGEWAQRILGRLFNVEGDLGVPIIPASNPEVRDLLVEGMEFLLARENRDRFLRSFDEATRFITERGYVPGIGSRDPDYVPFFYECPETECYRSRIELSYEGQGSEIALSGKCPNCGQTYVIETNAESPYLAEFARYLSPRVDTRQFVVDTMIPIVAHIGGPGETAYYAQVIPGAEAINVPFPLFIRYPRVYFNTPWGEELGRSLEEKEMAVLHGRDLFRNLGKTAKHRRKAKHEEMNQTLADLHDMIHSRHSRLNEQLEELDEKIEKASEKEAEEMRNLKLELERYLSWTFGQYAPGKLGQESSWSWIEWAVNSGFPDLFGPYDRAYVGEMRNGATVFVNFFV
jgi:uncharacterized protein YllA (UPF0747 family)